MTHKILFVCLGNICRSPAAENIMDHLIRQSGTPTQILCDSAGTSAYHIDSPPDRRMREMAKSYGIEMRGRARQISPRDLQEFDLILAMDRQNHQDILRLDPQGRFQAKVKMMCEYCRTHNDQEVPDPYYGGDAGFRHVIELLMDACGGLLESLEAGSGGRDGTSETS